MSSRWPKMLIAEAGPTKRILCYALVLPGRKSDFRAGFGRIATGKASKSALLPAFGRPYGRFRFFPGSSPAQIWPGRSISGPEALLRNIDYPPHVWNELKFFGSRKMWSQPCKFNVRASGRYFILFCRALGGENKYILNVRRPIFSTYRRFNWRGPCLAKCCSQGANNCSPGNPGAKCCSPGAKVCSRGAKCCPR